MNNFRLLTLISALFFGATGISSPLITLFYEEVLAVDYAFISIILTSVVLMRMVASYAWGRVSDWLGRRKPIFVGGLFGMAVTFYLISQAPDIAWAWGARLAGSLFTASFMTLALAIMGDILEQEESQPNSPGQGQKGRRMGLYRGLGSLAFAIGALIGGRLADAYSLRFVFIVCAGINLAAGLCALALKELAQKKSSHTEPSQPINNGQGKAEPHLASFLRQPLPYLFLIGVLLWSMAHSASASMWPNFMRHLGYTKTDVGTFWGLAAAIEMPAMYFVGILSDITGRALMLAAGGFAIAIVNLGYLTIGHYMPALLGIQVVRGFGFGSYTTSAMTFTAETGGQETRGRTSGIFNAAGSAGQLLGSYMGGTLVQWRGFEFMYGFCAMSAFCSGLCFLALRRWQANTLNQKSTHPA